FQLKHLNNLVLNYHNKYELLYREYHKSNLHFSSFHLFKFYIHFISVDFYNSVGSSISCSRSGNTSRTYNMNPIIKTIMWHMCMTMDNHIAMSFDCSLLQSLKS